MILRNIVELYFSRRDAAFTIFSEICDHRQCNLIWQQYAGSVTRRTQGERLDHRAQACQAGGLHRFRGAMSRLGALWMPSKTLNSNQQSA